MCKASSSVAAAMCRLSPRLVTVVATHVPLTIACLAEALGFRHESSSKAHKSWREGLGALILPVHPFPLEPSPRVPLLCSSRRSSTGIPLFSNPPPPHTFSLHVFLYTPRPLRHSVRVCVLDREFCVCRRWKSQNSRIWRSNREPPATSETEVFFLDCRLISGSKLISWFKRLTRVVLVLWAVTCRRAALQWEASSRAMWICLQNNSRQRTFSATT
jgi:hypothetical protein